MSTCNKKCKCCTLILFFTLDLLWITLQAIGTGSDVWVFTDSCSWTGLRDNCQTDQWLNTSTRRAVYDLQIASLALNGLVCFAGIVLCGMVGICGSGSERALTICFICFLQIPIFIAGLINIIGCLIVAQTGLHLGYSFDFCISTGIGVVLQSVISVVVFCCIGKNQREEKYQFEMIKR